MGLWDKCDSICAGLTPCPVNLQETEVLSVLRGLNPHKAPGPDGFKGKVLKECAAKLALVFTQMFQLSGRQRLYHSLMDKILG